MMMIIDEIDMFILRQKCSKRFLKSFPIANKMS